MPNKTELACAKCAATLKDVASDQQQMCDECSAKEDDNETEKVVASEVAEQPSLKEETQPQAKDSDADNETTQKHDKLDNVNGGDENVEMADPEQKSDLPDEVKPNSKEMPSNDNVMDDTELTKTTTGTGTKNPNVSNKQEEKDSTTPTTEEIKEETNITEDDTIATTTPTSNTFSSPMMPTNEHKAKPTNKTAPNIIRRLRKSTRAIRFRTKMSTNAGANSSGSGNGIVSGSTSQTHGNGAHSSAAGNTGNGSSNNSTTPSVSKSQSKGARSRRTIFKRPAIKTPLVQATTRFVTSVFFKGSYMQIGDIVSLLDTERNVYYAQIRGLLVDAYCEKSAFLTWLIPTQDSPDPKEGFDPATYLIGPDEEISRKLSFLEFVMHAPSNYYHDRTTPFPLPDTMNHDYQNGGYIWTHLPTYKRENNNAEQKTDGD